MFRCSNYLLSVPADIRILYRIFFGLLISLISFLWKISIKVILLLGRRELHKNDKITSRNSISNDIYCRICFLGFNKGYQLAHLTVPEMLRIFCLCQHFLSHIFENTDCLEIYWKKVGLPQNFQGDFFLRFWSYCESCIFYSIQGLKLLMQLSDTR